MMMTMRIYACWSVSGGRNGTAGFGKPATATSSIIKGFSMKPIEPPPPVVWRPRLSDHYGEMIRGSCWTHWLTVTFANKQHPDSAEYRWRSALRRANQKNLVYVRCIEYQQRGALHFHALVYLPFSGYHISKLRDSFRACCGVKVFNEQNKGVWRPAMCNLDMIRSQNGVSAYVSKYCTKAAGEQGFQIDFSKSLIELPPAGEAHLPRRPVGIVYPSKRGYSAKEETRQPQTADTMGRRDEAESSQYDTRQTVPYWWQKI